MSALSPAVRDAAMRWIADDVDAADRAELQNLLVAAMTGPEAQAAAAELTDRLAGPLRFGTAGLRGPLRAGPAGMNRAVALRTTFGLATWLQEHGHGGGVVVVGRDARHRSEALATDVAGVFAAAGFDTLLLPAPLPTPVLAYAVRALGAVAGVQVTASHNPPGDNGYKVYLDGGAQLVPPMDAEIEQAITSAPAAVAVPVDPGWRVADADILDAYLDRVASLVPSGITGPLRVAATPLHGVGGAVLREALRRAGVEDLHLVASQAEPDPDFPTVDFPNPEEPGAADAVLALAADVGADLAIALDPDADRCAVGIPDGAGGWRMLTGDETGVLLGERVLRDLDPAERSTALVASTLVSSTLLRSVAAAYGVRHDETRTGFKWLVRAGDGAGTGLVYAYEEALGHCCDPDAVRDKDGLSAAVLACDLVATALRAGRTALDLLDDLALAHGVHTTTQVSVRLADHAAVSTAMAALRADLPTTLGDTDVEAYDLAARAERPDNTVMLSAPGLRVMIRPSGTEPKLKAYLQVVEPVSDRASVSAARARAASRLGAAAGAARAWLGPLGPS